MTYADVAATLDFDRVDGTTISAAVRIFADAGLVELGEDDDGRFVRFLPVSGKVDLTTTERFAEGEAEREAFARFCDVVLTRAGRGAGVADRPPDLSQRRAAAALMFGRSRCRRDVAQSACASSTGV